MGALCKDRTRGESSLTRGTGGSPRVKRTLAGVIGRSRLCHRLAASILQGVRKEAGRRSVSSLAPDFRKEEDLDSFGMCWKTQAASERQTRSLM